ncbi:MAG: sulfurtransferase [Pseudomonadota bacterium]
MCAKPCSDYQFPAVLAADLLEGDPIVIDARKPAAREESELFLTGARVIDPFAFGHREAAALSAEAGGIRPIHVFCVHGFEVSHFIAALLLVHGAKARYVPGGFEAIAAEPAMRDMLREGAG